MYSSNEEISTPSQMKTIGTLVKESADYIIVENEETLNIHTNKKHPEAQPKYFSIPKGLILKMEY